MVIYCKHDGSRIQWTNICFRLFIRLSALKHDFKLYCISYHPYECKAAFLLTWSGRPIMLFPLKRSGHFEHNHWSIRARLSFSPPRSASVETQPYAARLRPSRGARATHTPEDRARIMWGQPNTSKLNNSILYTIHYFTST